jgi:ParB family chromosome partitioning protein
MTAKTKGLGRGLDAIFEVENSALAGNEPGKPTLMEEIDIRLIFPNPRQPRSVFDENALEELADSIKAMGVIQPITVKKEADDRFLIISGERRWRASQLAGLATIPVYIREADDQLLHEMSLVENIQRQDLNPIEIAISLQRLMDECSITQDAVAGRVGKKRSTVANYLRLLSLPAEVQLALKQELISMGHAKAIASAPEEAQPAILRKVLRKNLSVRQTEELVKKLAEGKPVREVVADDELPDVYTRFVEQFSKVFSDDIVIKKGRNGGGKIVIGFSSDDEIGDFLKKLKQVDNPN